MLLNTSSTIRLYTQVLFEEGKQRLRHILATSLSDIYITYDI